MKKILSVLLLTILSSTSFASINLSSRELNESCSNSDIGFKLYCSGYIAGYLDGLAAGQIIRLTFTNKKSITVGTLMDIFTREMNIHPEKGDEQAYFVLSQLLMKHNIAKIK